MERHYPSSLFGCGRGSADWERARYVRSGIKWAVSGRRGRSNFLLSDDESCQDLSGSAFDDWQSVYDLFQTERSDVARTGGSDVKLQTVGRRTRWNFLLLC